SPIAGRAPAATGRTSSSASPSAPTRAVTAVFGSVSIPLKADAAFRRAVAEVFVSDVNAFGVTSFAVWPLYAYPPAAQKGTLASLEVRVLTRGFTEGSPIFPRTMAA